MGLRPATVSVFEKQKINALLGQAAALRGAAAQLDDKVEKFRGLQSRMDTAFSGTAAETRRAKAQSALAELEQLQQRTNTLAAAYESAYNTMQKPRETLEQAILTVHPSDDWAVKYSGMRSADSQATLDQARQAYSSADQQAAQSVKGGS